LLGSLKVGTSRFIPLTFSTAGSKSTIDISGGNTALGDLDYNVHELSYNVSDSKIIFDGVEKGTVNSIGTSTITTHLFRRNHEGPMYAKARIYELKFYNNGVLTKNFKPCIDPNGVYCLYDLVEAKYYYNQGTGEFRGDGWLPTQLEYIEATGTQYVDTGVAHNSGTKVEIKMAYTNITDVTQLNGWGESNGECFMWGVQASSGGHFVVRVGTAGMTYYGTADTNMHTYILENGQQSHDGTVVANSIIGETSTSQPIHLFALYSTWGGINSYCQAKCYYCKIFNNNELIRDYIPALDENNVACLYDKVTQTFFYNQGTGSFTAGSVAKEE
jgi:hypothetical protein